ncbi:hypothetical protein J2X61_003620 [Bacillus sp. 3255]|nr:hypothetical protein [Bacillus sp. 3255]
MVSVSRGCLGDAIKDDRCRRVPHRSPLDLDEVTALTGCKTTRWLLRPPAASSLDGHCTHPPLGRSSNSAQSPSQVHSTQPNRPRIPHRCITSCPGFLSQWDSAQSGSFCEVISYLPAARPPEPQCPVTQAGTRPHPNRPRIPQICITPSPSSLSQWDSAHRHAPEQRPPPVQAPLRQKKKQAITSLASFSRNL